MIIFGMSYEQAYSKDWLSSQSGCSMAGVDVGGDISSVVNVKNVQQSEMREATSSWITCHIV